ncbi:MAG: hypothetical protein IJ460_00390 [Clostridia bacterium]|nr:hypothetical protein [Clostridia bacterium]
MKIDGWKYYNHAVIPDCAPHDTPDINPVIDGSIWQIDGGKPILARWTTNFDCGYDTGWYFVIKDTPFDIGAVNAKRRYEINKGNKNFNFRKIDVSIDGDALYDVHVCATETYGGVTVQCKQDFLNYIHSCIKFGQDLFGVYLTENDRLCGYSLLDEKDDYIVFISQKADPSYEKQGLNAALVYGICEYYKASLEKGKYICDGEKSILHTTAFQDYLEKYFMFRKAYCRLNIKFKMPFSIALSLVYPFRKLIYRIDVLRKIGGLLKMKEIVKSKKTER